MSKISDRKILANSLVNKKFLTLSLNSPKVVEWICNAPANKRVGAGCGGTWKESVKKRSMFRRCPQCEPYNDRKAVVHYDEIPPKKEKPSGTSEISSVELPLRNCRSTSSSTSSINTALPPTQGHFAAFDPDALAYIKPHIPVAKAALPLYEKSVQLLLDVDDAKESLTKVRRNKKHAKPELDKAEKKVSRLQAEYDDVDKRLDLMLYGDTLPNVSKVPRSGHMKQLTTQLHRFYFLKDVERMTEGLQSHLLQIPQNQEHIDSLRNNYTIRMNLLQLLAKKITKEKWEKRAKEHWIFMHTQSVERKAEARLFTKLTNVVSKAVNELKELSDEDENKAFATVDRMFVQLVKIRDNINHFIMDENAMLDRTEYRLLDDNWNWDDAHTVHVDYKPERVQSTHLPSQIPVSPTLVLDSSLPTSEVRAGVGVPDTHESPGQNVECPICYTDYPESEMSKCEYCDYQVCKADTATFILGLTEPARCMNVNGKCERPHTAKWLFDTFGGEWYEKMYKPHRDKMALDEARSHIPEIQQLIPLYQEVIRAEEEFEGVKLEKSTNAAYNNARRKVGDTSAAYQNALVDMGGESKDKTPTEAFIQGCPNGDCKGLVSAGDYKCKVCSTEICRKCHVILLDTHVCRPEDVETVKSLADANTKNCPNCQAKVFKIDGCDQMWCVNCHTAFDWRTEKAVKGVIHNPEYFRWMREQKQEIPRTEEVDEAVEECELDEERLYALTERLLRALSNYFDDRELADMGEMLRHVIHPDQDDIEEENRGYITRIRDLLVLHTLGQLSDEGWAQETLEAHTHHAVELFTYRSEDALATILTEIAVNATREVKKLGEKSKIIKSEKAKKAKGRAIGDAMMEQAHEARKLINNIIIEEYYARPMGEYTLLSKKWTWDPASKAKL